jgi:hypothetical protein
MLGPKSGASAKAVLAASPANGNAAPVVNKLRRVSVMFVILGFETAKVRLLPNELM